MFINKDFYSLRSTILNAIVKISNYSRDFRFSNNSCKGMLICIIITLFIQILDWKVIRKKDNVSKIVNHLFFLNSIYGYSYEN